MKVLFFGTYDADRHPRVRVLQEGFAAHEDEVVECNVPLGFSTDERVRMLKQPWRAVALARRMRHAWGELKRMSVGHEDVDAVVVGYMGHFDIHLARRLWPNKTIVLDHMIFARDTAIDRGVKAGPLLYALGRLDGAAVRMADIVLVDTEAHREMLPGGVCSVVAPVGATRAWFVGRSISDEGPVRAIFYGAFTPLQGARFIGEAISQCAQDPIEFTLVGHGQELSQTRAAASGNPHVRWIDWIDPEELPAVVAGHDVSLGIFGSTRKAQRVVPHKVFESAAAGCAIMTGDTSVQRRLLDDSAIFVPLADAGAIADGLRVLAQDRPRLRAFKKAAQQHAQSAFRPSVVVGPLRDELAGVG